MPHVGQAVASIAAAVFVAAVVYTLWSGKVLIRGHAEPVMRKESPLEYWGWIVLLAIAAAGSLLAAAHRG
jgi:hypothetical protein